MAILPVEDDALKLLIRSAREGDTEAFGRIYDLFFLPVYRYAAFRLPVEIAEDVTADTFVKAVYRRDESCSFTTGELK